MFENFWLEFDEGYLIHSLSSLFPLIFHFVLKSFEIFVNFQEDNFSNFRIVFSDVSEQIRSRMIRQNPPEILHQLQIPEFTKNLYLWQPNKKVTSSYKEENNPPFWAIQIIRDTI